MSLLKLKMSQSLVNEGRFPQSIDKGVYLEGPLGDTSRNPSLMRAGFHEYLLNTKEPASILKGRNPSLMRAGFHTIEYCQEKNYYMSQSLVNEGRFPHDEILVCVACGTGCFVAIPR